MDKPAHFSCILNLRMKYDSITGPESQGAITRKKRKLAALLFLCPMTDRDPPTW